MNSESVPIAGPSLAQRLKRTGPGLIIAAATIGPGSVTLACLAGAKYAYALIWVVAIGAVVRWVYQSMMYRTAIILDKPLMKVIREYNPTLAALTGIACFLSSFAFQIGNATGTAMGLQLFLPGIPINVLIAVGCVLAIALIWAKDVYAALQKVMTAIVLVMLSSFLISLCMSGLPSLSGIAGGLMPKFPDAQAPFTALGLFSTTVVFNAAVFGTYLGRQKKWSVDDIRSGAISMDVGLSVAAITTISLLIMITAAVVLNPQHIVVNSGIAMAKALEPVAGPFAKYVFGLGFFGAAISSLIVTSMTGIGLAQGGLGQEPQLESKGFRLMASCIVVVAGAMGIALGNSPVQLLSASNAASFVSLPVLGVAAILAANSKGMGKFKNNSTQNVMAWLSYGALIALALYYLRQVLVA
ncbi:MAG TPA: Nramp family divalent metal transporter [Firmicutes bacterium]|nr:Nramp family divalent metal transporter [Candidatus Fermentithermobacillaceae bacterium]